jgi:hypothetical protein
MLPEQTIHLTVWRAPAAGSFRSWQGWPEPSRVDRLPSCPPLHGTGSGRDVCGRRVCGRPVCGRDVWAETQRRPAALPPELTTGHRHVAVRSERPVGQT